jgi:Flp pilus assembly protein TadG
MSKHTSATERGRFLRRFARRNDGAVAIEFAFIVPALIIFTIGILEFGLVLFDYHRASEATRRASRLALIQNPLATLDTLRTTNLAIDCTANSGGTVSCTGSTHNGDSNSSFAAMLTAMKAVFPDITNTNVQVGYVASGIDDVDNDEIVTALVTVSLTGVTHSFIVLNIVPGVPSSITYPAFSTSALRHTEVIVPP